MTNYEKVGLFMSTFGQEIKKKPSLSTDKINNLRIKLIEEELKEFKEAILNKMPMQPGDVPSTYADVSRLQADLNYQPQVSITEGVAKFVAWYQSYYVTASSVQA